MSHLAGRAHFGNIYTINLFAMCIMTWRQNGGNIKGEKERKASVKFLSLQNPKFLSPYSQASSNTLITAEGQEAPLTDAH